MSDDTSSPAGCCGAAVDFIPRDNAPGRSALSYRLGVHGQLLARMIARIPTQEIEGARPLAALSTRRADDPAIALLDAWACAADVLCFYQERIANEGYLRTATERRSVLELARSIGYELNPGVAAAAYLAFTIDDTIGGATIRAGVQIQSVPGQDETPQLFEAVEEIEARAAWNAIRPRLTGDFPPTGSFTELWAKGVSTGLSVGAPLLVVGRSDPPDFHYLTAVEPDADRGVTRLAWDPEGFEIGKIARVPMGDIELPKAATAKVASAQKAASTKPPAAAAIDLSYTSAGHYSSLGGAAAASSYTTDDDDETSASGDIQAYTFRVQTWVKEIAGANDTTDTAGYSDVTVKLDAYYPGIGKGSWMIIVTDGATLPVEVSKAVPSYYPSSSDADAFKVRSLQVTALVEQGSALDLAQDRTWLAAAGEAWLDALIHAQQVEIELTGAPLTTAVEGDTIELDGAYPDLAPGRRIAFTGRLAGSDEGSDPAGEIAVIGAVTTDEETSITTLVLEAPLQNRYDRLDLRINANVVEATHGETVSREVIGSGDATLAHQVMALRRSPLTFVPASSPSGGESTLTVRVGGVAWEEVSSLYGRASGERVYATRNEDDGTTEVQFGDGQSGARLPTGSENVTAEYRRGLGGGGNVDAFRLTQLKTRPLGVRSVTNPAAASGGADPEQIDAARANAPLTTRTLDRLVSLRDYEDFARAFSGIAKATAIAAWDGGRKVVHVTVAGDDGVAIDRASETHATLTGAITAYADRGARWVVASYSRVEFRLSAGIVVDDAHDAGAVLAEVQSTLAARFGFDARDLAAPVTSAEIIAAIQGVSGVVAVDLDALYRAGAADTAASLSSVLVASPARWDGSAIQPAELLVLADGGAELLEMTS